MDPQHPISIDTDAALNAQAAVLAQLLGPSPDDLDDSWRQATALADGLFPHQVEGVAFLLGRRSAILADDMGLGKTRQAIVSLRHDSPDGPFLVVCPRVGEAQLGTRDRGGRADGIDSGARRR
jgi:SNF2 family DNA or RNA helicase